MELLVDYKFKVYIKGFFRKAIMFLANLQHDKYKYMYMHVV